MTQDEIIEMAQEIAAQYSKAERFQTWTHDYMMQRLMELVAAEREACAKVCDTTPPYPFRPSIEAAHAIRARGDSK